MKPLSAREREVYDLTRAGVRAAAIAAQLGIATSTVYALRHRALEKLDVSPSFRRLERGPSGLLRLVKD